MSLKHKKKYSIYLFVLFISVFHVPTFAWAFPPDNVNPCREADMEIEFGRPPMPLCGLWRNPKTVQDLKLTDQQVLQLKNADFAFREKNLIIKAQLDNYSLEMEKAYSTEQVDEAFVLQIAQKIADLKGKMFVQVIKSHFTFEKLLTADQLRKIKNGFLKHYPERERDPRLMGRLKE